MRVSPPTVRTGRAAPRSPRPGATGAPIDPEARLAALLDRQLWCLGRDVRRAGNLLIEHGFARRRPPGGVAGASAYRLELPDGRIVGLWGFALHFGVVGLGGIVVARRESLPRPTPGARPYPDVWLPGDLAAQAKARPAADRAQAMALRGGLLAWIGGYERWVGPRIGAAARRRDLAEWPGARGVDLGPTPDWDALAACAPSLWSIALARVGVDPPGVGR